MELLAFLKQLRDACSTAESIRNTYIKKG